MLHGCKITSRISFDQKNPTNAMTSVSQKPVTVFERMRSSFHPKPTQMYEHLTLKKIICCHSHFFLSYFCHCSWTKLWHALNWTNSATFKKFERCIIKWCRYDYNEPFIELKNVAKPCSSPQPCRCPFLSDFWEGGGAKKLGAKPLPGANKNSCG